MHWSVPAATVIPVLTYPDVRLAVDWLSTSLGFVARVRIGVDHRAHVSVGEGAVIVADTGGDRRPPEPTVSTHSVTVQVADVRALRDRAAGHGAVILNEPTDFPYGERQCTLRGPWGHQWTLSETIADIAPEDWGGVAVTAAGDSDATQSSRR